MKKTVMPLLKIASLVIFFSGLSTSWLMAQRGFNYNSREDANKQLLEKYRDELFDNDSYEKFLKEQENALFDSLDVEKKILLSPEELKKLGIGDEVIAEILKLQLQQDSIGSIKDKYDKLKKKELGVKDSVSLEDVEQLIEQQKEMIVRKALSLPEVELYGHGFFRKNLLKLFDEEVKMRVPENYTLSVGDEVSIVIWGDDNYSRSFLIDDDGSIAPKLVGKISLRGLTFADAKSLLKKKFSTAFDLRKSNFKVSLNYTRIISVNLVGELFNPGTYTFPALNSVYNALVAIEGPNNMGSVRNIFVKRNGETIKTFDLYKYLTDPNSKQDFFLEDNDYVVVPSAKNLVAIEGEVKRPFTYELIEEEGIMDLLNYCGGLKSSAHTKAIAVKRVENNEEILLNVDYQSLKKEQGDFALQDGDSVFVYKLPDVLRNYVQVVGAVKIPGKYQLRKGERIADLLFRAEGVIDEAYIERGYVFGRDENLKKKVNTFNVKDILANPNSKDNIVLNDLDTIQILNKENFRQNFPVNISGAVHLPGEYVYADGLTLKDLLFYAGGLKQEAANNRIEISRVLNFQDDAGLDELTDSGNSSRIVIDYVDVAFDLSLTDGSELFELKPYDHIFVRTSPDFELQQNVKLQGEVKYPGKYSLVNKNERISSLIKRAGGLTDYAFIEGATLFREQDSIGHVILELNKINLNKRGQNLRYDYILTDGDSLHIPKIKDFVSISGAVNFPGIDTLNQINVPWEGYRSAKYYINKYAASFDGDAKKRSTLVTQANGKVQHTQNYVLFKKYPVVEKGGNIFVDIKDRKKPENRKQRINRRQFNFEQVTAAAIPVLTLIILLQQALSK